MGSLARYVLVGSAAGLLAMSANHNNEAAINRARTAESVRIYGRLTPTRTATPRRVGTPTATPTTVR